MDNNDNNIDINIENQPEMQSIPENNESNDDLSNISANENEVPAESTDSEANTTDASNTEIPNSEKENNSEKKHTKKQKTSSDKNRIVKSKKDPEYLPGLQKKLFVDVRDEDELTFIDKIKAIFTDFHSLSSILIYALILADLIGITLFAKKCGLNITQALLYKVHFDSLAFDTYTFLEISIIAAYIFAFIFGGLVTFAMVKLGSSIAKNIDAMYSHKLTRIILGTFIVFFAVFAIVSYVNTGSILSIATQSWLVPLFTFVGGLCMYCISLRNVEIY